MPSVNQNDGGRSPPSPPSPTVTDADYISAVGICGIFGYEAEVNQVIGLCHEARNDDHILLTVAQTRTHRYKKSNKHRLQYACRTANLEWFTTLFKQSNPDDIVTLRTERNETLYHLVCTLPSSASPILTRSRSSNLTDPKISERLHILNFLDTTDLDVNVKTNSRWAKQRTAFDILSYALRYSLSDGPLQLLCWWLNHLDRFDPEKRNHCLPWLAYEKRLDDVRRLCRIEGMDLNIQTACGRTALIMAASNGYWTIVNELLQFYPQRLTATDLNHQTKDGKTALFFACRNNHIDIVQQLCRIPEVDLNLQEFSIGFKPWGIACSKGHTAIVDELLRYYPERLNILNHRTKDGETALYWACLHSHNDIVKKLCAIPDIDLNIRTKKGDSILSKATQNSDLTILNELLNYPDRFNINRPLNTTNNETILYWASTNNHIDIVKRLCAIASTDLSVSTLPSGDTPLICAIDKEYTAIVDILLQYVPDRLRVNQQTSNGNTALMIAVRKKNNELVQRLCRIPEINIQLSDKDGNTAISIALGEGYTSIVDLLRKRKDRDSLSRFYPTTFTLASTTSSNTSALSGNVIPPASTTNTMAGTDLPRGARTALSSNTTTITSSSIPALTFGLRGKKKE